MNWHLPTKRLGLGVRINDRLDCLAGGADRHPCLSVVARAVKNDRETWAVLVAVIVFVLGLALMFLGMRVG